MFGSAARKLAADDPARRLFDAIGHFLDEHQLGPDPANYAFAYRVISAPDAPLARTVAALTDGRVRLTSADVAALGGSAGAPGGSAADRAQLDRAEALAALTRAQVQDFTGLVDAMRAETSGFGRDLAASVDALDPAAAPEIVTLSAAMLRRVETSEARLAAVTDEAEVLRGQLEEARGDARTDELTGLANRRALTEAYEARIAAGERFCIAICDVDRFKHINDRFGHQVGDRVLGAIAAALAEACDGAFVARYGGEEFALLFAHADLTTAFETLDAARACIAGKRYRSRDDDTPLGAITFSAGLVTAEAGEGFTDAFARADRLLYTAKQAGRNLVQA